MSTFINLTGEIFGELTVIERAENAPNGKVRWKCKCDCGKEVIVKAAELRRGDTKSCGCLRQKNKGNMKHGLTDTKLNMVWRGMKARCYYPKHVGYKYYGAKNIGVCKDWKDDYMAFYSWSIKNGYKEGLKLDRIDGNEDYSPQNCRWVDIKVQNNNRSNVRKITFNGETKTISEWSKLTGLDMKLILMRIYRNCPTEKLFDKPKKGGR